MNIPRISFLGSVGARHFAGVCASERKAMGEVKQEEDRVRWPVSRCATRNSLLVCSSGAGLPVRSPPRHQCRALRCPLCALRLWPLLIRASDDIDTQLCTIIALWVTTVYRSNILAHTPGTRAGIIVSVSSEISVTLQSPAEAWNWYYFFSFSFGIHSVGGSPVYRRVDVSRGSFKLTQVRHAREKMCNWIDLTTHRRWKRGLVEVENCVLFFRRKGRGEYLCLCICVSLSFVTVTRLPWWPFRRLRCW